jgi:hypothetical protein
MGRIISPYVRTPESMFDSEYDFVNTIKKAKDH